ncbi:MAG TPA: flagellar hook-length control protein [Thermoanaerobaculia bacterium]|nr:flagellar hook-length control protein [Thermoanaerobaculia bacterium]
MNQNQPSHVGHSATSILNRTLLAAFLLLVLSVPTWASGGFGMTWVKGSHNSTDGTDLVGCSGCNPYVGDTACSTSLPVLCFKSDGSPTPADLTPGFYTGWKGGHISTTPPVPGTMLTSLAAANQICVNYLGAGYGIAEFHSPQGGFNWSAYGDVRTDYRFWTYINDQNANCWN